MKQGAKKYTDAAGPASDHDVSDAKAGWPAAGDDRGLHNEGLTLSSLAGRWPCHYLPDFVIASSLG
jgi:hypothetical protein